MPIFYERTLSDMKNDWEKRIRRARALIARGRFQRFVTKELSGYEKAPVSDRIRIEGKIYVPFIDIETEAVVYVAEAGKNQDRVHTVLTFSAREVEAASKAYDWYDADS